MIDGHHFVAVATVYDRLPAKRCQFGPGFETKGKHLSAFFRRIEVIELRFQPLSFAIKKTRI